MAQIVLTEEQAGVLATATEAVEVLGPQGRLVNFLKPLAPALAEAVRESKRRLASDEPRIPSAQVQAHLRKLEEVLQREGEMDEARMKELLRRMQAGEVL